MHREVLLQKDINTLYICVSRIVGIDGFFDHRYASANDFKGEMPHWIEAS